MSEPNARLEEDAVEKSEGERLRELAASLPKKYPVLGAVRELYWKDGTHVGDVRLTHLWGAARLYDAETASGDKGVIAFQPDGTWWVVRGFEDWKQHSVADQLHQ